MYYIPTSDNVNIAVHDIAPKNEKTIVMIHGWPLDSRLFEYQVNVLPQYGYRCILIDLRGFGNSNKPWDGYSYDRLAEDIYTVISQLRLSNFSLLGFSMGGAIVSRYMNNYNGYGVSKLILVSAAVPRFTQNKQYPYAAYSQEQVNNLINELFLDRPATLTNFGENFFFQQKSDSLINWFRNMCQSESSYGTIKALVSLRNEDLTNDLQSIKTPTAIFHGLHDKICPFSLAQATHKLITNSQLHPFESSGHGVLIDEIEQFNLELLEFLDS